MSEYVFKTDRPIKNCYDCEFMQDGFCHVLCSSLRSDQLASKSCCPLVELPPHGDLIDRSELIIVGITDYAFERHTVVEYEDVQNAPTVLEASEE